MEEAVVVPPGNDKVSQGTVGRARFQPRRGAPQPLNSADHFGMIQHLGTFESLFQSGGRAQRVECLKYQSHLWGMVGDGDGQQVGVSGDLVPGALVPDPDQVGPRLLEDKAFRTIAPVGQNRHHRFERRLGAQGDPSFLEPLCPAWVRVKHVRRQEAIPVSRHLPNAGIEPEHRAPGPVLQNLDRFSTHVCDSDAEGDEATGPESVVQCRYLNAQLLLHARLRLDQERNGAPCHTSADRGAAGATWCAYWPFAPLRSGQSSLNILSAASSPSFRASEMPRWPNSASFLSDING